MKPVTFKCDFCAKIGNKETIEKHELVCPKNPKNQRMPNKTRSDKSNLIGRQFGYLTVIDSFYTETDKKHSYWLCKCKCGNTCIKRQDSLFKTPVPSCGCYKKENASKQWSAQLEGKRFGKLVVIERVKTKNKRVLWKCKCDCGEICYLPSRYLLSLHVTSCGCETKSSGELIIRQWLKSNNLIFKEQFSFADCKSDKNRRLKFDFAVFDKSGKNICLIEVNGDQHYAPIKYFGGEEKFQQQKKIDMIKRAYCKNNGINFIELTYLDLKSLNSEKLMELLKSENDKVVD